MRLIQFLLARYAEDESLIALDPTATRARRDLARLQANVRIVEQLRWIYDDPTYELRADAWESAHTVLLEFANVYADHPDFRRDWYLEGADDTSVEPAVGGVAEVPGPPDELSDLRPPTPRAAVALAS